MMVPLIRSVRDRQNAEHDVLRGPCACGANHQSESDYFDKLGVEGQGIVLETRRQTVVLPPLEKTEKVEVTVETNGDKNVRGLVFKVQISLHRPAIILSYPEGHAPADGLYLGDNNFVGLPDQMAPGIYRITADYDFSQGYFEGHQADGESSWEYTVTAVERLQECLARVFMDSGAITVLCRKEKDHEDSLHEATVSGDIAEFNRLGHTEVTISWEDNG